LGPENTLATFKKAIALGVDAIELDIHQSEDGHLMVIHDLTLDRTYGKPGRVDRMTLKELRDAGVPTLQEVIDTIQGRCRLFVEIKQPKDGSSHVGIEARLLRTLRVNKLERSAIVISFYKDSLRRLHELDPKLVTGYLFVNPGTSLESVKQELGVSYVAPHYLLSNASLIERAHDLGLKVNTWTVNDPAVMKTLLQWGADAITTNDPQLLQEELKATAP